MHRLIPACAGKTVGPGAGGGAAEAHPRVCGENEAGWEWTYVDDGSSPRVRGKLGLLVEFGEEVRLIPACAGKTGAAEAAFAPCGAHPRVCGENTIFAPETPYTKGSSPRVRGKPGVAGYGSEFLGLIPACAGKTPPMCRMPLMKPAHPRVCGENSET